MKVDARFRQVRTICCLNILTAALVAAVILFAAPFANAQSTGGRIRGTVTDTSGAAIAAAKVTILMSRRTHPVMRRRAPTENTSSSRFL